MTDPDDDLVDDLMLKVAQLARLREENEELRRKDRAQMTKTISFTYLNHRGAKENRTVDVECLEFIREPGFGYQSGWFISGLDHKKNARRSFALDRIIMDEEWVPKIYRLLNL